MKKVVAIIILFIGVLFASRHGYVFPVLGSLINLAIPPEELYEPIDESLLMSGEHRYNFLVSHKYPGNYLVYISVPKLEGITNLESDISVGVLLRSGEEVIYQDDDVEQYVYWGSNRQGLGYNVYHFSNDISERTNLNLQVILRGDVDGFIQRYNGATIGFRKGSDE